MAVDGRPVAQLHAEPREGGLVHGHGIGLREGLPEGLVEIGGQGEGIPGGLHRGDLDIVTDLLAAVGFVSGEVGEHAPVVVDIGHCHHVGMAVDQGHDPTGQAAGVQQRLRFGRQDHQVPAGAVDRGGERLADADEHADLRQHQQAGEGQGDHGGEIASPLIDHSRKRKRHGRPPPVG